MNSVFCAAALLLLQDPENWTECVLGHQSSKNLCVCQKPNPALYKCFRKQLCQVNATLAKLELDPHTQTPARASLLHPAFQLPYLIRLVAATLPRSHDDDDDDPRSQAGAPGERTKRSAGRRGRRQQRASLEAAFREPLVGFGGLFLATFDFPPPPAVSFFTTEKQVSSLTVYKTKRVISSEGGQKMFFARLTIFLFLKDHRRQLQHGRRSAGTCRSSNRIDATQTTFSKDPDRTPTSLRQIGPQPGIGSLDPLLSLRRQLAGPRGRQPRGKGHFCFRLF